MILKLLKLQYKMEDQQFVTPGKPPPPSEVVECDVERWGSEALCMHALGRDIPLLALCRKGETPSVRATCEPLVRERIWTTSAEHSRAHAGVRQSVTDSWDNIHTV